MRKKIIRYEAAGRGILSIKDAFYLTGSSSPPVIHLPSSFPSTLVHDLPSIVPPCRSSRHVAAACYLVLLKGYFSRPLPLFFHSHRFTKGARNCEPRRMSRDHEPPDHRFDGASRMTTLRAKLDLCRKREAARFPGLFSESSRSLSLAEGVARKFASDDYFEASALRKIHSRMLVVQNYKALLQVRECKGVEKVLL